MDNELCDFKQKIDLREFVARFGYEMDTTESTRTVAVMRRKSDKIHIRCMPNGDWTWYSFHDGHGGSIIDFLQDRENIRNLGEVRKKLRSWSGYSIALAPPAADRPLKDLRRIRYRVSKMAIAREHPYLEHERRIPGHLLTSNRFLGRVRIDHWGNAVFPHDDESKQASGFEIRGADFKGFSRGGRKGLWQSHEYADDNTLVFCESAIDVLSYAALFPSGRARYASIAGGMSDYQRRLITASVARMPAGSGVIAAMDWDAAGRKHTGAVYEASYSACRDDLAFQDHSPDDGVKDWNDALARVPSK